MYVNALNVNEVFGPTTQGEGPASGERVTFLRLAGCNLSCSWCDTPYTWDWTTHDKQRESHREHIDDVVAALRMTTQFWAHPVVVSGGEPLLQSRGLATLLRHVESHCDVETNGTRPLADTQGMWRHVVVSPKIIPSAEQGSPALAIRPGPGITYKYVIDDERDVDAVLAHVAIERIPHESVMLMPQGRDADTVATNTVLVASAARKHGFATTSRLHVMTHGDERGY